ncbi:MAG: hypothetical protein Q9171_007489, partial [Xanthocarpia ochracea]
MEPVSAVASVLAIVTAAVQVTKALHDVLVDIKDAPKDIARLCDDVHSISTLLSSLEDTLKHEPYRRTLEEESPIIRSLEQLKAPLKGCTRIIEAIQIKVTPFSDLQNTVKASKLTMGAQPQSTDPVLRRRASTDTDAGFALRRYIEAATSIADNDSIGPSENDPDDAVEAFALSMREPPNVQELLHQAVTLGRANLVRPLLAQGADLSKRHDNGRTLLLTAIYKGHEEVVKVILEEAANISRIGVASEAQDDEQGEASETQDDEEGEASESQDDEEGEYEEALWAAVSNRQIGVVKMLLAAQPRLPLRSATTLVHAVVTGSTEIAQMLIENGAAVTPIVPKKLLAYSCVEAKRGNQSPSPYEWHFRRHMRPLSFAAYAGHAAIVDELLNAGADPREDVPILYAVKEPSIIAKLLAADAKLHANSENTLLDIGNGDTVLGAAARGADVSWVKNLLSLGAEPAARGSHGMTPREIANGVGYLVDTADVQEVLGEAEESYYGHRIPI